jgi:hypothetical protein
MVKAAWMDAKFVFVRHKTGRRQVYQALSDIPLPAAWSCGDHCDLEGDSMLRNAKFHAGWLLALAFCVSNTASAAAQVASVTLQSLDGWLDAARYSLTMAGHEEQAKQLDGLLEAVLQSDGFKGIDTKKPLGVYLPKFLVNPTKPPLVGFVPITQEKEFLDFLGRLNVTVGSAEKGLRKLEIPTGQTVYLRFDKGYGFVAEAAESLQSVLPPDGFAKAMPSTCLAQIQLNLDQIPAPLKKLAVARMDAELAKKKEKQAGESQEDYQGRLIGMKLARDFIARLVEDSQGVRWSLSLDKTKHQFAFEAALQAVPGSVLQQEFQQMAKSKTAFAKVLEGAPAALSSHGILHDSVRADLNKLVDAALQAALNKEKSVVKRAVAEKVFQVLEPTLKSATYDSVVALRGGRADQPLTGILAVQVKHGKQMEQLARELVEEVKGKEREYIHLDAQKVGETSLHVIQGPPEDEKGKEIAEVFGAAKFTLAFQEDAVYLALGKNGPEEIKRALTQASPGTSAPGSQPAAFQLDFHGRAFTRFEKNAGKRKAFEEALSQPGSDLIRLTVRGGDDLQFRLEVSSQYLKLAKALKDGGD